MTGSGRLTGVDVTDNNDVAEENVSKGRVDDKWKTCTYTWSFSLPILKFSVESLACVQGKNSQTQEALGRCGKKGKNVSDGAMKIFKSYQKTAPISESSLELCRKDTVACCRPNR